VDFLSETRKPSRYGPVGFDSGLFFKEIQNVGRDALPSKYAAFEESGLPPELAAFRNADGTNRFCTEDFYHIRQEFRLFWTQALRLGAKPPHDSPGP